MFRCQNERFTWGDNFAADGCGWFGNAGYKGDLKNLALGVE
ncbi:hypothetical protein [Bartonella quintana]|nr:hypothetical protein [Bartonella quintana]